MAQRDYTPYQQKIIQRYYDNRDQLDDQRLSELVAELYLAGEKKKSKLWQQARDLMSRLGVPDGRIEHVVKTGDPAILAEVVKDLQAGKIPKPAKPPTDKRG
jgi:hypothetical protein